jgi:nitroimidazol reductase NimA-like FMN-containing flavoprotein (pyridoxamine 5'-phosphate oxidase superfamily)
MEAYHGLRRKEQEITDTAEKRHALAVMIRQLEQDPDRIMAAKVTDARVKATNIGRIDIEFMSGKRTEKNNGSDQ